MSNQVHEFEVLIRFPDDVPGADPFGANSERLDALHSAGCDDATVSVQGNRVRIYFSRSGEQHEAVGSAIANIRTALPDALICTIDFYH